MVSALHHSKGLLVVERLPDSLLERNFYLNEAAGRRRVHGSGDPRKMLLDKAPGGVSKIDDGDSPASKVLL